MIGDALLEALRLLAAFDPYVFEILYRSIRVSGGALFLAVLTGLPAGVLLGLARFPGRRFLVALVYTGFALPPVVVGLVVYLVLSHQGPAGSLELLFSPSAIVIAQALLAAPYVTGVSLAAIQAVPPDVRLQARALGASPLRAIGAHLREARLGILAAVALIEGDPTRSPLVSMTWPGFPDLSGRDFQGIALAGFSACSAAFNISTWLLQWNCSRHYRMVHRSIVRRCTDQS